MTAQPEEYPQPIERPRTVGALRQALPESLLVRFEAALSEAPAEDLFGLVARWAVVAQVAADPGLDAAAALVRAGEAPVYDLGEVFPALADLR